MAGAMHFDRKAIYIADNLVKHCLSPDGGKRFKETGSISPGPTLKHHGAREAFRWCDAVPYTRRFFTLAAIRKAIIKMLKGENVSPPLVAGLPFEMWLENQSKTLLHLCQRSRRNTSAQQRFPRYRQRRSMDWQETVPYEARICVHMTSQSNICI